MGRTKVATSIIHHELARRMLMKQDVQEISQQTGMQVDVIERALRKPEFLALMQELQDKIYETTDRELTSDARDIQHEIKDLAGESLDGLKRLMRNSVNEGIVTNISQDFLDRAGHTKRPELTSQTIVNINPIEASIINIALKREEEGRKLLEGKQVIELAKSSEDVDHPMKK